MDMIPSDTWNKDKYKKSSIKKDADSYAPKRSLSLLLYCWSKYKHMSFHMHI